MSTRPAPVAITSAMLMDATKGKPSNRFPEYSTAPYRVAQLASAIHRLAPACKRLAEAECNGEWRDGQRNAIHNRRAAGTKICHGDADQVAHRALDKSISDYALRLDTRVAKLNSQLAPFGYQLVRQGDPRGATLMMAETPVRDSATHYTIG